MKRQYLLYIPFLSCIFSACSKSEDPFSNGMVKDISLSAVVNEVKIITRSSDDGAYTGTVPSVGNALDAAVWFSLNSGSFPSTLPDGASEEERTLFAETNIPVHGEINFQSGTATFPKGENEEHKPKYPTNDRPVYCVGFYPKTGWDTVGDNASKATHAITGLEDLMFAPEITGRWNQHFSTQRYRHLLTWLKICICTTTPEAGNYWGKLKNITLKELPNALTIDLTKPEGNSFSLDSTVSPSDTKADLVIPINQGNGIDMSLVSKEVASVFCYPSSTYTLSIECENGSTINKTITLETLDDGNAHLLSYPAGLQYVLILYFHPYNVVDGVCTLNAWNAQNEDLYGN